MGQLVGVDRRVVGLDRREVGEDGRAVDPFPPERVVGEPVGAVPRQLLGEEPVDPAGRHDPGEAGRVAEHVGDPDLGALHAEVLLEEPLAVGDLADQRLAARQVGVGLDPHAADRDPLASGDLVLDALEDGREALAHPVVLDGLAAPEHELGVLVHERQHVGERPAALAAGLSQRPEPGRVDVGVADRRDLVGARVGRPAEHLGEALTGLARRAGHVVEVERVEHVLEGAEDLVAAGLVVRQLLAQPVDGPDVLPECDDVGVRLDERGLAQVVDRAGPGGGDVAVRVAVDRDLGVGRRLDQPVDGLAALRRCADRQVVVERVQAAPRHPVVAVADPDEPLRLEPGGVAEPQVDGSQHGAPGPVGRDGAGHPEPGGAPRSAEHRADLERLERGCGGLGHGDRFARHLPGLDGERVRGPGQRRVDAVAGDAEQASLDEGAVVVHGGTLPTGVRSSVPLRACAQPQYSGSCRWTEGCGCGWLSTRSCSCWVRVPQHS